MSRGKHLTMQIVLSKGKYHSCNDWSDQKQFEMLSKREIWLSWGGSITVSKKFIDFSRANTFRTHGLPIIRFGGNPLCSQKFTFYFTKYVVCVSSLPQKIRINNKSLSAESRDKAKALNTWIDTISSLIRVRHQTIDKLWLGVDKVCVQTQLKSPRTLFLKTPT